MSRRNSQKLLNSGYVRDKSAIKLELPRWRIILHMRQKVGSVQPISRGEGSVKGIIVRRDALAELAAWFYFSEGTPIADREEWVVAFFNRNKPAWARP